MNKKYDVVTVGLQCIDIVASRVPGDMLRRDLSVVDSVRLHLGGDALNQAMTLSRLGARTAIMGVAGTDRLGDVLLDQLKKTSIDVLDRRTDGGTAVSIVLPDEQGERHFLYQPASNDALSYDHVDEDALRSAAFVSVGGCMSLPGLDGAGMIRLLETAKAAGAMTAMDFRVSGTRPDRRTMEETLQRADYVLPSAWEASVLTGETEDPKKMAGALRAMGANNCVIKLGGEGCYVAADGFEGLVPACPCRCVDTTGAGDTFVGAFLYARTRGWDLLRCARFANAAGAIAVEHPGANGAIRSLQQVLERMEQTA